MTLWTSKDAENATGGKSTSDWTATGLSIDTRTIEPGELFVALKDQRDGHDFVAAALEKGAAAALVSYVPEGISVEAPLLVVKDVLPALEDMARFARERTSAKVVGVTGSVGKTSTKEMLRTALTGSGKVHAAERSFNNHWGVPLTLARMPADSDFAVIEIGMNHPEEIRPLAKLAKLDVAIVTTVAAVHMEAFNNIDEIAHAKAEIFDGLKSDGFAVVNGDIITHDILFAAAKARGANLVRFGQAEWSDFKLIETVGAGMVTSCVANIWSEQTVFKFQAAGQHFAMNALAVLAAADAMGVDLTHATLALANWTAPEGRGARSVIELGESQKIELIDESYNANPSSMNAALNVLATSVPTNELGRKIAILGEMGELGETELERHAELADLEAVDDVDMFHLVGPMMEAMYDALPSEKRGLWVQSADELVQDIKSLLKGGDVVMVKGSNYTRVSKIVEAIKEMAKGED